MYRRQNRVFFPPISVGLLIFEEGTQRAILFEEEERERNGGEVIEKGNRPEKNEGKL